VTSKENLYGKELIVRYHDLVETESDEILKGAEKENVSLLVVRDPFG
jgi:diphthine synthase